MKTLLTIIFATIFSIAGMAQDKITMCHTPPTESFALFASNKQFNADHRNPLPYKHQSDVGKMITYGVEDGKPGNAYFIESKVESDSYLLVIHEWWGLNDYIKKEADKLYDDLGGIVNVMALDLYDGQVASTREEASKYMSNVKGDRARAIIQGALDKAGTGSEIATIGWCFGGGWSLQAALMAGEYLNGCVMYYGMPETDVSKLKNLGGPVLGIFAKQDGWINEDVVEKFKVSMAEADKVLRVEMYDANHAFANPSNPDYNKKAAEDAYKHTLAFLKQHLD